MPFASAQLSSTLSERLRNRTARVAVIGLGYVGLPLAIRLAEAGFEVEGIDVDASRVARVEKRIDLETDGGALLAQGVDDGRLRASTSFDAAGTADVDIICVPTPLNRNREPDTSYVAAAAGEVAARLRRGQLVILESTTYPGTTEELVKPILESNGLRAGVDFYLAYSPERVDPGNSEYHTGNTPKVIGGLTSQCSELARLLYASIIGEVHVASSPAVAEMSKLLENIFRSVNIALVNELALLSRRMGIDIWEVVRLAATKPYGFMAFSPGPGMGGHCIPVDPFYLSWKAREFALDGIDGRTWTLADARGAKGTLVIFICNHCPYVRAIAGRLAEQLKALQKIGIGAIAIMANDTEEYPEDSFDNMKRFAKKHGFTFPYVIDRTQEVAKAYGAICTPDFFGFNARDELHYRGRLDESKTSLIANARPELVEAMTQIAKTGEGPRRQTASMGCSIKWRAG